VFIRRLSITGFGCLGEVTREFPPGGFLVLGPNESGKSTLVRCIEALLFGYQPREAKPWQPWEGAEFVGEIELADGDGGLHVRRRFADNQTTVTRRDTEGNVIQPLGPVRLPPRGTTHERDLYASWLLAAVGMDSADLFRRTLYVPQGRLQVDVGDLDGVLRSYMTGGGLDVEAVARTLAERRRAIAKVSSEGRANPGELDRLRLALESTRVELDEARRRESRLEQLRTELADLETTLDGRQTEHNRLAHLLETAGRARQLRQTTARLEELLSHDRQARKQDAERRSQVAKVTRQLKEEHHLVENEEAIRSALAECERCRGAVATARGRLAAVGAAESKAARVLIAASIVGAIGAAVGALISGWPGAGVGLVLGFVLGFTLAWLLLVLRPRATERRLRRQDLDAVEKDLARADEALSRLVPTVAREGFAALGRRLDELQLLAARKDELEGTLLSDEAVKKLDGQVQVRAGELEAAKEEQQALEQVLSAAGLSEEAAVGAGQRQRQALEQELNSGRRRLQRLREEAAELRGARGRAAVVLAEEVEELEEREVELAGRFRALQLAEDVWAEALRRFQETYLERYTQRVGRWLQELSGKRYDQVRIHAERARPEARQAGTGRWVPVDRLSQGAKDALYLALRLALAEVMGEQGVRGPLILDDPFVTFDADRLADAFETLGRLAERRQVILLAHDERYRELGWPVWDLPRTGHGGADEG